MRVQVGDVRLYFDVDGPKFEPRHAGGGERPTIVLLHPGPGPDHSLFKDALGPELAGYAQVVYLDLRGHGRSDRSVPALWNTDVWTEDVHGFLRALEIERPVLFGTSLGAMIALRLAARHPESVGRVVAASAGALYVPARAVAIFDRLSPGAGLAAAAYFADPNDETFVEYLRVCVPLFTRTPLPAELLARMEFNMEAAPLWERGESRQIDLREEVGRIRCPVLVLNGEDDPSFAVTGEQELVESLPRGLVRLHRFPNAGHGVFRDAPVALPIVREFVLAGDRAH